MKRTLRQLYSNPAAWTKNALARTRTGRECNPSSGSAVTFCLLGAVQHCYSSVHKRGPALLRLYAEIRSQGWSDVHAFNNSPHTSISDIRAVVEAARI